MSRHTPVPGRPGPADGLLPAFAASLTGHGGPGVADGPRLRVDVLTGGDGNWPAGGTGGGAVPAGGDAGPRAGAAADGGTAGGNRTIGGSGTVVAVVLAGDGAGPGAGADGGTALGELFVPPDDDFCWTQPPDPDNGCPAELAGLTEEELQARITPPPLTPAPWPEGIVPPDGFPNPVPPTLGGPGFGFGQGDPLDTAVPGPALAALAEDTSAGLGEVDADCLTGIIRAWRRITSWATGRELAAIAELARRFPADGLPGSGREYVADELAAALTLTCRAAQDQRDLAGYLATVLPATLAALSAGLLDLAKARVLATGTAELAAEHAAAVEAAVLPTAPGLTTGQLRAAVAKAVLTADPAAAARQREAAQARAHVSCWTGQAGTAHLEGHDLPPAQTLAADARLGQIAAAWKAHGALGGADLLRAHAYLALLLGHDTTSPPASLLTPGHTPADPGHPATHPAATTTGNGGSPRPHTGHPGGTSTGSGGGPGADAGQPGGASSGAAGTSTGSGGGGPGADAGQPGGASSGAAGTSTGSGGGGPGADAGHPGGASSGAAGTSTGSGGGGPGADAGQPGGASGGAAGTSTGSGGGGPGADAGHPGGTSSSSSSSTTTTSSSGGGTPGANPGPGPDPGAGRVDQPGGGPQAPPGLRPPAPEPGYGLPPVAAMINLTVPLATLLHLADRPGEATGYGPLAPATAQALADAAAGHPATRWTLTVTSPDGHAIATGTTRRGGGPIPAEGWTVTVAPIAAGDCDHHNQEPGYRPSPALARLIRTRNTTCCFPGCRRPARRCDLDHTIPYEDGGRTCECDLAPLCRRHHQVKQAEGWTLSQPSPGVLAWLTPAGRRYTTLPSQHPT